MKTRFLDLILKFRQYSNHLFEYDLGCVVDVVSDFVFHPVCQIKYGQMPFL